MGENCGVILTTPDYIIASIFTFSKKKTLKYKQNFAQFGHGERNKETASAARKIYKFRTTDCEFTT